MGTEREQPYKRSPFNVRGIAYRGAIEGCNALVPGGFAALLPMLTPELRAFMSQTFIGSSWYDIFPLYALDLVAAERCGLPWPDFVRMASRVQAMQELSGLYRSFLRLLGPNIVASIVPRLNAHYYDFGTVKTRRQPYGASVEFSGAPRDRIDWIRVVGPEYIVVALELCGAADVKLKDADVKTVGYREGYELVSIDFHIGWRAR